MLIVLVCWIASSRLSVNHVFAASSCVKKHPFCLRGSSEVKSICPFYRDDSFFMHESPLLSIRGFWEFPNFLDLFYLIFIIFHFSNRYKTFEFVKLWISGNKIYQICSGQCLVLLFVFYSLFVLYLGKRGVVPYCSRLIFNIN